MPTLRSRSWPKLYVLGICLLISGEVRGEDWPRVIHELKRLPATPRQRQQLSVAHNNYAIELMNQREWNQAAIELQRAVALDGESRKLKKNLAVVYVNQVNELRQDRRGRSRGSHVELQRLLQEALRHDPQSAAAYLLIGDIEYDRQQLTQAKSAWETAQRLDPTLPQIDERLQKLSVEHAVEKRFDRVGNLHFDLRYQGEIPRSSAVDLQSVLEQARKEVGRDFSYFPQHRVVVLVYSEAAFRQVRRGPDWVGGVYDGKIRVPFPEHTPALVSLRSTLYHEYTHALIHDLTRGRCPVWLNEGLAEFVEAKTRPPQLQQLQAALRSNQLLPWDQLDGCFQSRDAAIAALAYQQSYSIVAYLDQQYRFHRIRGVLEALSHDATLDDALQTEFRLTTQQLEQRWRRWLPSLVSATLTSQ